MNIAFKGSTDEECRIGLSAEDNLHTALSQTPWSWITRLSNDFSSGACRYGSGSQWFAEAECPSIQGSAGLP
jgi:hypothetical protein